MQVLGMCLSYGKSGFQEHQWRAFLFMAQLTQILFVFRSVAFGDIKDHSLRTTLFNKKISMEVLRSCLPYVKRYFQEHQWSALLLMVHIIQIL